MLIDAETLPNSETLRAQVVVVGAGPAGISLALELGRHGVDVLLLESGRPRPDAALQRLGDAARFDPAVHAPMNEATRRQIGGASVIWGGRCVPYDRVDFDDRPFVPEARWPVGYDDIAPYFQRTSDYFFTGSAVFNINDVPNVAQKTLVPGLPDGDVLTSELERWSLPTDFGRAYRDELTRSPHVRVVHGLTCTEVVTTPEGDRVDHLAARTLQGRDVSIVGARYVLAAGGVETTRLLLASDRVHPGGVGNHSDHLGRWYMGHISGRIARVRFTTPPRRTVFGFDRDPEGVYVRRRISFSREFQLDQSLTNVVSWIANPTIGDPSHHNGVLSFAYLALTAPIISKRFAPDAIRKSATKGAGKGDGWRHVGNMLRDLPRTAAFVPTFGYKRFLARRRVPGFFQYSAANTYDLHYHGEQVPRRDSTIRLSDERDVLGMRRVALDLRYDPRDIDVVLRAHGHWSTWFERHGVGALEYVTEDPEASVWEQAGDGFHQVGTTRMSAAPGDGVVGPDCSVHGFDDLFVASSAIFPSSGQANSTFMIVAFGLRLADQLRRELARPAPEVGAGASA